jgi:hypothetical protein
LIRFLSWLSIALIGGAYLLLATDSNIAHLAAALLLLGGAILGLFLMGRGWVTRIREVAREVAARRRT